VASGNLQRDSGRYTEALDLYVQAVEKYRSGQDHKNAASTLSKIAEIYSQIGDYSASTQWYGYSLNESEQANDLDAAMTGLTRLRLLALQLGDRSTLAKYAQQDDQIFTIVRSNPSLMPITGDFALAFSEMIAGYGAPLNAVGLLEPLIA